MGLVAAHLSRKDKDAAKVGRPATTNHGPRKRRLRTTGGQGRQQSWRSMGT
jgi:hypothetical protein